MPLNWTIRTKQDLEEAVERCGFLPLFANSVPGFSVEEHAAPEVWYREGSSDWPVWAWKGPVIRECGCAYGRFFEKKAVFVSREWFPDLANWRRDGYDFDARFDDGLASYADRDLYELTDKNAPVLSRSLKSLGNWGRGGRKGFDTSMNRLQAQTYIVIGDFVYDRGRDGREFGWGIAAYTTPERFFGPEFRKKAYACTPEESREKVLGHLCGLLPEAKRETLRKILG